MKESNSIDYNQKISNFMAMTEIGDPDIATQYLTTANWDETLAVNNFFNQIQTNINQSNSNNNILNSKNKNNNDENNSNNWSFFSFIIEPIKNLFSSCYDRREVDLGEEDRIFQYLPNKVNQFDIFIKLIKKNIGIIILYNGSNIQFLNNFISQICRNTMLINLLKQNFIIYPLLIGTDDASKVINIIKNNNLIYPSFVFCHLNSNNNSLEQNNILNILESEATTLEVFHNQLLEVLEKINKKKNIIKDSYNYLTDAEILQKQKNEMEALEKQVQKKEEELKQEKINEEKKLKEIEKKANDAKLKIVEEPNSDNPDTTIICFRYPDGEKRIDRKFLKSNTIQNLYDFVTSLGKEIYTEEENTTFSLYQPFPPKKYEIMENTLEQEGLFPNAIIQIKEE